MKHGLFLMHEIQVRKLMVGMPRMPRKAIRAIAQFKIAYMHVCTTTPVVTAVPFRRPAAPPTGVVVMEADQLVVELSVGPSP
jgi:hypothetical protein